MQSGVRPPSPPSSPTNTEPALACVTRVINSSAQTVSNHLYLVYKFPERAHQTSRQLRSRLERKSQRTLRHVVRPSVARLPRRPRACIVQNIHSVCGRGSLSFRQCLSISGSACGYGRPCSRRQQCTCPRAHPARAPTAISTWWSWVRGCVRVRTCLPAWLRACVRACVRVPVRACVSMPPAANHPAAQRTPELECAVLISKPLLGPAEGGPPAACAQTSKTSRQPCASE